MTLVILLFVSIPSYSWLLPSAEFINQVHALGILLWWQNPMAKATKSLFNWGFRGLESMTVEQSCGGRNSQDSQAAGRERTQNSLVKPRVCPQCHAPSWSFLNNSPNRGTKHSNIQTCGYYCHSNRHSLFLLWVPFVSSHFVCCQSISQSSVCCATC